MRLGTALVAIVALLPNCAFSVLPIEELQALVDLYSSTNGAFWMNSWTMPSNVSQWQPCGLYGLACSPAQDHVVDLYAIKLI